MEWAAELNWNGWPNSVECADDNAPVGDVTHQDCLDFARWLTAKEHRKYDLPTEAQWEYAARGGLVGKDYPWGNEDPDGRAVFGAIQTEPVGSYAPNAYGLYDMAGNVGEFVKEAYSRYSAESKTDPIGPLKGDFVVARGGGLQYELKVYERDLIPSNMKIPDVGFRLVCQGQ